MPNITKNYSLKKPFGTESVLISVLNENFDTIDTALNPAVSDTTAPTSSSTSGLLATVLGWFANRIKAITGKSHWYDAPPTTLSAAANHMGYGGTSQHPNATTSTSGFMSTEDKVLLDNATAEAYSDSIIIRDSFGRAKVASPNDAQDAANKSYVDNEISKRNYFITGNYTGDGELERTIPLSFTPSCVIIMDMFGNTSYDKKDGGQFGGMAMNGLNCLRRNTTQTGSSEFLTTWNYRFCLFGITLYGIRVTGYNSNGNTNDSNRRYFYIAFR